MFLGAVHVISTEAESDPDFLHQLSQQIGEVSISDDGVVITSLGSTPEESPQAAQAQGAASESAPQVLVESLPAEAAQAAAPGPAPLSGFEVAPAAEIPAAEVAPSATPEAEPAATVPCTPDESAPYCTYLVLDGDTLWDIADKLGLTSTDSFSSAELIAMSNDLNDSENWLITVGQELRVPAMQGVVHTVADSESVSVLAQNYGVALADVVDANGIADPNSVVVGDTIVIPSPSLWPLSGPAAPAEPFVAAESDPAAATEFAAAVELVEEAGVAEPEGVAAEETAVPENVAGGLEIAAEVTVVEETASARASGTGVANPSVSEIRDLFSAGFIAAVGPPQYLNHLLESVIACESGYNLRAFNPVGPFYGLMQFLPETWERMGGGDWFDPWQQGHNTGVLLRSAYPETQWPVCWG